ncbi:MAG: YlbF family regulator [Bacillus sp. (in: firmicutes)]
MTVSVNEGANQLGIALQNSEEYQVLKGVYQEVNSDPEAKVLFEKFRNMQLQMQEKQMNGQEIGQEEIAQAQTIVADVQKNEKISNLMVAEEKMNNLIVGVNQIVLKPLEDLYKTMSN